MREAQAEERKMSTPAPSRVQPTRTGKKTTYTDEDFGKETADKREKRWRYAGFEPGPSPSFIRGIGTGLAWQIGLASLWASV